MTSSHELDQEVSARLVPQKDSLEFSSGLLLGALVGAGLTLLVAPHRTPRARIGRRLRRPRRRVRRQATETRNAAGDAARESADLARELQSLGREVTRALRTELANTLRDRLPVVARKRSRESLLDRATQRIREFREGADVSAHR